MKVAIVHDWLYGGGAERVVYELHKMFPDAPIYTSYCSDEWRKKLDDRVVTGYLQHAPFRQLRKFLPVLRQRWFARLDLSEYDLVISSSGNGEAKFVDVPNGKHVCYCHTPNHFYWRNYETYLKNPGFRPKWLVRLGLRTLVGLLRKRDYAAAQEVDYFIANSTHIQKDIKTYYGRESAVVYPPIRTAMFQRATPAKSSEAPTFVTMGRQVPHKKFDVIVQACTDLSMPLTVIGRGPEHERLTQIAGPTVTFKTDVTDVQMPEELAAASAFIFASLEDFGIAPVEAMAAGRPVIAFEGGGALDYVVPGKTGEFFAEQTVESLAQALQKFDSSTYDARAIRYHAASFSEESFAKSMRKFLKEHQFYM